MGVCVLYYSMKQKKIKPDNRRRKPLAPSSQWFRDEIAIMQGHKSFTPDKTTAKGPVNLGPDGNSLLPKNRL